MKFIRYAFMEILGSLGTNVFWVLWHAWLHSPKMLVSSCRRLQCLSACKKSLFCTQLHHSLLSYDITFLRILQFDWLAAFWPIIGDPKFFQICWWNINSNISLHFRLFLRKTNMTQFFKKSKKIHFGAILGPFYPNFGKNEVSWKKGLCQLSSIRIIYHCVKNQKNLTSHSWENCWTEKPKTSLYPINFFVRYSQF